MLTRWTLRSRQYICITLMLVIVVLLSVSGLQGVFKYRRLTKNIRARAGEFPEMLKVERSISKLRNTLHPSDYGVGTFHEHTANSNSYVDERTFNDRLHELEMAVDKYDNEIQNSSVNDPRIGENDKEVEFIKQIRATIMTISQYRNVQNLFDAEASVQNIDQSLEKLQGQLDRLPSMMSERMNNFAEAARTDYHTWIFLNSIFAAFGFALITVLLWKFNSWFLRPVSTLVEGSRKVASGDFTHRIVLNTQDELAELAAAMNDMTTHFCEIRDTLDRKVRERTNEVVRNEQLASVGFLAAGVAHEINNPMATIAWSAESLESRLIDWVREQDFQEGDPKLEEADVILKYMRRIQDEAFRVKGITDGLLDFSRLGTSTRVDTDLRELVDGIIDMVKHLGKYRARKLTVHGPSTLQASVCTQSIKQVALNLITNALDSVDEGGQVDVFLDSNDKEITLKVVDNGCGMSPEVLHHIFEPFFTQKRDGQGTGLGLAIAHRIVADHSGTLLARSHGQDLGAEFCVTLPRYDHAKDQDKRSQAA